MDLRGDGRVMTPRAARPRENPLVPHASLRAIYTLMLQARLLEERLGTRAPVAMRGEEACRASAIVCLGLGDLVSDPSTSPAADLLLGRPLRARPHSASDQSVFTGAKATLIQRLPVHADANPEDQLRTALGAAHALKLGSAGRIVLHFSEAGALPDATWRRTLREAGAFDLPLVLVVLPTRPRAASQRLEGQLSDGAQGWGVPGIPVDTADAVALFRVLREAVTRARAGDGAALIECIAWRPAGAPARRPEDPVRRTAATLLARGAAPDAWLERAAERFAMRLSKALPQPASAATRSGRSRSRGLH